MIHFIGNFHKHDERKTASNNTSNKLAIGITFDNKLVMGNMTSAKAVELGIRDCVNVSSDIGPFLIINGEPQDVDGVGGGLNPRTAIGQRADGAILLLVVDGRQATSLGASFSDLQDIMLQYGAVNASASRPGLPSGHRERTEAGEMMLCWLCWQP